MILASPQINQKPKLPCHKMAMNWQVDEVRTTLRTKHYSKSTEEIYISWIKQFILYHNKTHPEKMEAEEIKKFITYLANERNVSSSTQNQALNAILYLYKNVIKKEINFVDGFGYVKRIKHLPVVFSRNEAAKVIEKLNGIPKLIVSLLYGTGIRLGEVLSLRVKDIDFEMNHIIVREGSTREI